MEPLIQVRDLFKIFGNRARERALPLVRNGESKEEILRKTGCVVGISNASFDVFPGEIFVIMGLSGSGKSTVVRCLNRLIEPTSGSIAIGGEDVVAASPERLREIRRKKLGMVFQKFALLPHRTVIDNVAFGLEIQGVSREERHRRALETIESVGLSGYEHAMTQTLSGGMQQRVGLARALANDPEVLLMDEAFSALDPLIRVGLQDELLELQARRNQTIIFITHDLDEALKIGARIAIMKAGEIVQIGTPEEILTEPANDYVKAFVENVDRSRVITAGTAMRKTEVLYLEKGPHLALRQLRQTGLSTGIVTDAAGKFCGYVTVDDLIGQTKKVPAAEDATDRHTLWPILKTDMIAVREETPLSELMTPAAERSLPIAVVDERNRLRGIVTRAALLGGIAGD